jgi:hypothetical protein
MYIRRLSQAVRKKAFIALRTRHGRLSTDANNLGKTKSAWFTAVRDRYIHTCIFKVILIENPPRVGEIKCTFFLIWSHRVPTRVDNGLIRRTLFPAIRHFSTWFSTPRPSYILI